MRQLEFERRYDSEWDRFEVWLKRRQLSRRARRALAKRLSEHPQHGLADADVPQAYRALCAQLALARQRRYAPALVARLQRLVLGGHHTLYGAKAARSLRLLEYLRFGFPRLVRAEWRVVALSTLLFFGPLLGLLIALHWFPDFAATVLAPEQLSEMQQMYDPANHRLGRRAADTDTMMFGFYIWNNVRIGFQTFAGGVLFGLGSLFFLIYNGVHIGAVLGHLTQVGLGPQIWSFVAGHSALELVAIAISGAAGLKLGAALLMPGRRSRRHALVEEGRTALALMGGAALMFVAAAAVEAFWSPLVLADARPKYAVGLVAWFLVLAYLGLAGRRNAA
ncbi:MAG TPA: stage II sporulation protein M [Xanthomonadaceae bacterium]|nr:stage II sporulation protein M [Xanthomonadaceae bacterium]